MKKPEFCCLATLSACIILMSMSCTNKVSNFEYSSDFYRIELADTLPFVKCFFVYGSSNPKLVNNPVQWKPLPDAGEYELREYSGSQVGILKKGTSGRPCWRNQIACPSSLSRSGNVQAGV